MSGTSGGGKTTLVNLVPRFYEATAGEILIDGRPVRDLTLASLRGQIGIVTQQTILFNDTVGTTSATVPRRRERKRSSGRPGRLRRRISSSDCPTRWRP